MLSCIGDDDGDSDGGDESDGDRDGGDMIRNGDSEWDLKEKPRMTPGVLGQVKEGGSPF